MLKKIMKGVAGLNGVDRAVDRLLVQAVEHQRRGETEFWVSYGQDDTGGTAKASGWATLVTSRLRKTGYEVVTVETGGRFGDDVRILVRCPPR